MAVSISAALLLGIIVVVLYRHGSVRLWPAVACTGFGYFLSSSTLAPAITGAIGHASGWISSLR